MIESILEKMAMKVSRKRDFEEEKLTSKTKRAFGSIVSFSRTLNRAINGRGGLSSMRARGVFVKDGDIYSRRVIVKAKFIKNSGKNFKEKLRQHLEYISRHGAGKDGGKAELFSDRDDLILLKDIRDRFSEAPHNFKFIISPEDGEKLDLEVFTKELINTIEEDLGTKIDWVAAVHHDTNNPHVHLLINGLDKFGEKLYIKRDYITRGIRNRASQKVGEKLGLRQLDEVIKSLMYEVDDCKKCALDSIIKNNTICDKFDLNKMTDEYRQEIPQSLFEKRLQYLESLDLAKEEKKGVWVIKADYVNELNNINYSKKIVEKICGEFSLEKHNVEIKSVSDLESMAISGSVIKRGKVDELEDGEYLIIRGDSDKHYYVELEKYSEKVKVKPGERVRIEATKPLSGPKRSDETIDKQARANEGIYDAKRHEESFSSTRMLPPNVTAKDFVDVHLKRLEILAEKGLVRKLSPTSFAIPKDYLDKLSLEAEKSAKKHKAHVRVNRLSPAAGKKKVLSKGLAPC